MFPLSLGCHYTRIMPSFVLRFCVDLMDGLREIPNREALKLRAEASSNKISPSVALIFFLAHLFVCLHKIALLSFCFMFIRLHQ